MISRLSRRGAFATALLLTAFGAPQAATTLPAGDWLDKVDSTLITALQKDGKAEFLVRMNTSADLAMAAAAKTRQGKGEITVQILKAHAAASQKNVLAELTARGLKHRSFWIANAVSGTGALADIQLLALRPEVAHIYLVKPEKVNLGVNVPGGTDATVTTQQANAITATTTVEPGLKRIGAEGVWALGFRGAGVVVGDHDIGVEWTHPALQSKYRGWSGSAATSKHDYNWRNAFEVDTYCANPAIPCDSNSHGTHTTGTMVGEQIMPNGDVRTVGMAPDAKWIGCRSLYDNVVGAGTVPTYMDCMEFMIAPFPIGQTTMGDPDKAPDVVSNSWGCLEACAPPILKDINDATEAAGIIQVVSAGNDGDTCSTIIAPLAVYDSSFTVGASNTVNDGMAGFSSRGPVLVDGSMRIKPNVVAPGVGTVSTVLGGAYGAKSGTSMAGPHVAGMVALILSAEPRLKGRVREVRSLIERTANRNVNTNIEDPVTGEPAPQTCGGIAPTTIPNSVFGFGRVDGLAAVLARPMLAAALTAPETAKVDANYGVTINVTQPATGKLDVTNAKLAVQLPAGVTLVQSSVAPASTTSNASGTLLSYSRTAAITPGGTWAIALVLKGSTGGAKAITTNTEADQVSPKAGGTVSTLIQAGATPFTFAERSGVPLSSFVSSEEVTLAGFTGTLPIGISEGGQYQLNGGAFTNSPGNVSAGDKLVVRHTSSGSTLTKVTSVVTVGDYSTPFSTTTTNSADDAVPDAFSFGTKFNQTPSSLVASEAITLTAYTVAISVVPGPNVEYSINGAAFTRARGTLLPGQTLAVRHTTSSAKLGYTKNYLRAGGVTGYFVTRNRK